MKAKNKTIGFLTAFAISIFTIYGFNTVIRRNNTNNANLKSKKDGATYYHPSGSRCPIWIYNPDEDGSKETAYKGCKTYCDNQSDGSSPVDVEGGVYPACN